MSKKTNKFPPRQPIFANVFGEPFVVESGQVVKISPETGDREVVCPFSTFVIAELDDYWTGKSLQEKWELENGPLAPGHCLVPITPFSLGGEYSIENLMMLSAAEAQAFYAKIRDVLQHLADGQEVSIEVTQQGS